jgi:hypothetical protein
MDPRLAALLPLIPERVARVSTGSAFLLPDATTCAHAERVAFLARLLHWMSPLEPLSKDDQRFLGLVAANGRPVGGEEEMPGEEEVVADDALEEDLELPEYERQGSLGTQLAP